MVELKAFSAIPYGIKNVKYDETAGNLDNIDFSEFFIKF
jgi:hypothetical protein